MAAPGRATGRRTLMIVAILFALQVADGLDQTALAFAAPAVRAELGLGAQAMGAGLSAGFLGTALGSIVFGTIGDRMDRRTALCLSAVCFALGSLATTMVGNAPQLFVVRLLTGIALGGFFPIVAAIVVDVVAQGARATAVTFVSVGTAAGASLCGPLAALLEARFGWRAIFMVGFAVPAALALVALMVLPRGRPGIDGGRTASPMASVTTLFVAGRWRLTLLLWTAFVASSAPMFFSLSWLPSLARAAHLPVGAGALGPAVFSVAGLVTALVVARVVDRVGIIALAITSAAGVPAFLALAQSFGTTQTRFLVACGLAGAVSVACVNLMGTAATLLYEDSLRSRGVGWAVAVMRLGGALAPAAGGLLIGRGVAADAIYVGFAAFPALAALCIWRLAHEANRREPIIERLHNIL